MAIDYDKLMNWPFEERLHDYDAKDCILYALGCGLGYDPVDRGQLRFIYEHDLQVLPTMAVVLAYPGFWLKEEDTGVDWVRVVHGEQSLKLHRSLPAGGSVAGRTRVSGIVDKGAAKGALIYTERTLIDRDSGETLATLESTTFCRGDGGFGGPEGPAKAPHRLPERAPDESCRLPTLPQQALIYRLSGDMNPLHADPEVARKAGFDRPILHGLSTFAVAGHALLKTACDYDPARLAEIGVRFSAPVFPGETIRTELWRDGEEISFRAIAEEREAVVLDNGFARVRPA